MSVRKKCTLDGHKFKDWVDAPMPYIFCNRWFCDGSAVSRHCPPELAISLHNAIPWEDRFPQVELNNQGEIIR